MNVFSKTFEFWAGDFFDEFVKIINQIKMELDIQSVFVGFDADDIDANADSCHVEFEQYMIRFNSNYFATADEFAFLAAHELKHVQQMINGKLSKKCVFYKSRMLIAIRDNSPIAFKDNLVDFEYFSLPWEFEANVFAINFLQKTNRNDFRPWHYHGNCVHSVLIFLEKYGNVSPPKVKYVTLSEDIRKSAFDYCN